MVKMMVDGVEMEMPADMLASLPTASHVPRVISGTEFLALFTPAEVGAMIAADPRLLVGALKVAAQDAANLDSSELDELLQLAVGAGVLSATRAAKIKAGISP